MHACLLIFTKKFPNKEEIERIMSPYEEEYNEVLGHKEPIEGEELLIRCDYWRIGGRYNGALKIKVDKDDDTYRWSCIESKPRNGRLFWSSLLLGIDSMREWTLIEEEYFNSMGMRDGFLYVDGGKISDIVNMDSVDCFAFVGYDELSHARQFWDGDNWATNPWFDKELKSEKEASNDGYVTVIDYHW